MSVEFEQMFADMTSSPEVANQLISALRNGSNDSPVVATELIAALRADRTAPGQGSPAVASELLGAVDADAAADGAAKVNLLSAGVQTEDRTPRETRQTQVSGQVTLPCGLEWSTSILGNFVHFVTSHECAVHELTTAVTHFHPCLSTDDAPQRRAEDEDRQRGPTERHEEQTPQPDWNRK